MREMRPKACLNLARPSCMVRIVNHGDAVGLLTIRAGATGFEPAISSVTRTRVNRATPRARSDDQRFAILQRTILNFKWAERVHVIQGFEGEIKLFVFSFQKQPI